MGSRRAVAHLWVLAESLSILGPWLELADASGDNGCLSMAEPVYIRAKRQLVVGFVAPQGPPRGAEGSRVPACWQCPHPT